MRLLLILAAVVVLIVPVSAKELTITLADDEQSSWIAVGRVFDQCVAAATLRSDAMMCREVASFLAQFREKVRAAQQEAAKPKPEEGTEPPK